MSHGLRSACGVALAVVLAACSTGLGDKEADGWAESVDRWLVNSQAAMRAGIPNLSAFLTPDVVIDHSGTADGVAEGRDAALSLYRDMQLRDPDRTLRLPAYLSPAGVVVLSHWTLPAPVGGQDAALAMTFSRHGLRHQESALSVDSGRRRLETWRTGALARDWAPLEVVADRYLATWSDGDGDAATALYDPSIEVRDGLSGVRVDGLDALLAGLDKGTTVRLDRLPDGAGPAVFGVTTPLRKTFDKAVLLVTVDDGSGCPGHSAVVLDLGRTGKVTREQRYLRLDDARRCLDPAERRRGWWDRLEVPAPIPLERTATVRAGATRTEVWNGTPELVRLLRWALDRFDRAGLPAPEPASVAFYPSAPRRCSGYAGLASGPQLTEVSLCFGAEQACPRGTCPPWPGTVRSLVLHELAHTWLSQQLDAARQQRYLDAVQMEWFDPVDRWEDRGIERAASTVAWGLDEEPGPLRRFGSPPERELAEQFRLLTGHDPL